MFTWWPWKVYAVGYGTGAVYVAVIPFALLHLYMRQHIVLKLASFDVDSACNLICAFVLSDAQSR